MLAAGSVGGGVGEGEPSPTKRPRALHKYAGIHKKSLNVLMIVENNQLYVHICTYSKKPVGNNCSSINTVSKRTLYQCTIHTVGNHRGKFKNRTRELDDFCVCTTLEHVLFIVINME